jgi:small-conductance mechanosensitive channel
MINQWIFFPLSLLNITIKAVCTRIMSVNNDMELGDSGAGFGNPTSMPATSSQPTETRVSKDPIDFENIKDNDTVETLSPLGDSHIPSFWKMLLAVTLIVIFSLLPAFLIWWTGNFETYDLRKVRMGAPDTNYLMEYIRYSLFLCIVMSTYWIVEWFIAGLPNQIIHLLRLIKMPVSKRVRNMAGYFVKSRHWFTLVAWIVVIAIVGGSILYRTQFVKTLSSGLFAGKTSNSASGAVSGLQPVQNIWYWLERLLIITTIFTLFFALAKYLIELVKISFHRMAFEARVTDLNNRFQVINNLYQGVKSGKKVKLERIPRDIHLLKDRMNYLTTEKKAHELAEELYSKLVPPGREFMVKEDLANFFSEKDLPDAFHVFDKDENGDTNKEEIADVVMEVYNERKAVAKGILNNDRIIHKLDTILVAVAIFFTFTLSVPVLQLGGAAIFVIFGLVWTGFGFLFQNTAKTCFESFIFVFVEHAYDVGDRVIIDGEYLTVERVEIFTTIFRRWDGTSVYIPNSNLSGKSIYNVRRSATQTDFIDISLAATTSINKLYQLRNKLANFAKSEVKSYTGVVEIAQYDLDGDKIKVQISVEYRTNFQDAAVRAARRNKFMAMLKESAAAIGIEYFS